MGGASVFVATCHLPENPMWTLQESVEIPSLSPLQELATERAEEWGLKPSRATQQGFCSGERQCRGFESCLSLRMPWSHSLLWWFPIIDHILLSDRVLGYPNYLMLITFMLMCTHICMCTCTCMCGPHLVLKILIWISVNCFRDLHV